TRASVSKRGSAPSLGAYSRNWSMTGADPHAGSPGTPSMTGVATARAAEADAADDMPPCGRPPLEDRLGACAATEKGRRTERLDAAAADHRPRPRAFTEPASRGASALVGNTGSSSTSRV